MAELAEKPETSAKEGADQGPREPAPAASGGRKAVETRHVHGTRPPDIAVLERQNWLVHQHYVRRDFQKCQELVANLIQDTDEMCEYAIYVLGLIKRQEGDILASLELFQKVVKLSPNSSAAIKQVARSLFLLGKHKVALETYSEALTLCPQEWEILHNMGVCCIYLKDYDQAVEKLEEALKLSPQTVSYSQLCRVHLLRRELGRAVQLYEQAIQYHPQDPDLLCTLGLLYLQTNETKKAFECLGGALTFDPSNSKAILAAGAMIQEHGDYDVALTKYRVAAAACPESPYLWNNIGMCLFGKSKHIAAISCLKRAVYLTPFEWKILYNLGLIHLTLNQYASAYHFLKAAISLWPKSGQLYMLLAVALTHLDDYENACRAYEQAISLDSGNTLAPLNYSILLFNHSQTRAAAKQFSLFEGNFEKDTLKHRDQEIEAVAARLGPALHIGKDSTRKGTEKNSTKETRKAPTGGGEEAAARRRAQTLWGRGGVEEEEAARRRAQTLWARMGSEGEEDYQEPSDAIPLPERKLSSWF